MNYLRDVTDRASGMCFFVGGIFHPQQTFHEAISEVGSNLMLVAAGKKHLSVMAHVKKHTDTALSRSGNPDYLLQLFGWWSIDSPTG